MSNLQRPQWFASSEELYKLTRWICVISIRLPQVPLSLKNKNGCENIASAATESVFITMAFCNLQASFRSYHLLGYIDQSQCFFLR